MGKAIPITKREKKRKEKKEKKRKEKKTPWCSSWGQMNGE